VGAGPAGLVLALALSINGVTVRLVDREQTYRVGSKGAGIMVKIVFIHILRAILSFFCSPEAWSCTVT
jgi:2-polyprenyl-6-methoxyphenol hydroxylase-like FAD-dependent oxidoreductase